MTKPDHIVDLERRQKTGHPADEVTCRLIAINGHSVMSAFLLLRRSTFAGVLIGVGALVVGALVFPRWQPCPRCGGRFFSA